MDKLMERQQRQNPGGGRPLTKGKAAFGTPEIEVKDILLTSKLGSGCFGTVWKGTCFQKDVAVKIPVVQRLNPKQLSNLRKEVEIMSSNPHPNICLFMGACTVPGQFRIITELMDGDVETLLHSDERLSLYERMKMAKDAALGMNWLHHSTPVIIHRDLKTANLLIEKIANKYRVKLCDFGLSEIKPREFAFLQDERDGAKGTPLWMPPEVMKGQKFDEKSDVYSFGIVLWEILTRKDPFPHHDDYDEFVRAICDEHERPPIPNNCLPTLNKLMQDCWAPNPADRPDFETINNQLDIILIEAAIADLNGHHFWQKCFLKQEEVDADIFVRSLYSFLGLPFPKDDSQDFESSVSPYVTIVDATNRVLDSMNVEGAEGPEGSILQPLDPEIIKLRCLKAVLISQDKSGKALVNVEKFGQILEWFGPLIRKDKSTFLDRIAAILQNEWFHGDIQTPDAQRQLADKEPGTFLVRFSTNPNHPGCYTISRTSSSNHVAHIRISHLPGEDGFCVNEDHRYDTLEALIDGLTGPLDLRVPCSGSKYNYIFRLFPEIGGYQSFH